jgi:sugar lactone lactonase YvrE
MRNRSATPFTHPNSFTREIEGPACDREGNIYAVSFAYKPTIGKVTPAGQAEVFVDMPEGSLANGIRFDRAGRMFIADHTGHAVWVVEPGTRELRMYVREPSMHQPNDLAISEDGTLWASDSDWQNETGQIWRIDGVGACRRVATDMGTTNGIEVSPDGRTLWVNETVQRNLWAFRIAPDGSLHDRRLVLRFDDFGTDGMRCDIAGYLYVTRWGKGTVAVISPGGQIAEEIDTLGSRPTNICFGGPDGRTAYVTEAEMGRLVTFRAERPGLEWTRWQLDLHSR